MEAAQALRTTVQSPPPVGSLDRDPELPTVGRKIPSRSSLEQPYHSEIVDAEHRGLEHLVVGGAVDVPVDVVGEEASVAESCSLVVACTLAFADSHLDLAANNSTVAGPDTADSKEVVRTAYFVSGSEKREQLAPVCQTVGYRFAAERSMRAAAVARSTAAGAHNLVAPYGTAAGSGKAAARWLSPVAVAMLAIRYRSRIWPFVASADGQYLSGFLGRSVAAARGMCKSA